MHFWDDSSGRALQVLQRTVEALAAEGRKYVGVLYGGFMLTKESGMHRNGWEWSGLGLWKAEMVEAVERVFVFHFRKKMVVASIETTQSREERTFWCKPLTWAASVGVCLIDLVGQVARTVLCCWSTTAVLGIQRHRCALRMFKRLIEVRRCSRYCTTFWLFEQVQPFPQR